MSLKDWLLKKLSGDHTAKLELSAEEESLSGLNLKEVIDAHMQWKDKLNATLNGTAEEKYEVETVSKDNLCILGKWLYGPGKEKFSKLPEYEALRKIHADFHVCAASVLTHHEQGSLASAAKTLNGEFKDLSNQIQLDLVRLFTTVQ